MLAALAAVVCLCTGAGAARPSGADAAPARANAKRAACAKKRRCRTRRHRPVVAPPVCPGADVPSSFTGTAVFGASVECLVDQVRVQAHRLPLTPDACLRRAAAIHDQDMAVNHYFAHDSPAGQSNEDRIAATGYVGSTLLTGENIAYASGAVTPRSLVAQWLASPPHRANILDGAFRDTGVAVEPVTPDGEPGVLVAQVFGRRG